MANESMISQSAPECRAETLTELGLVTTRAIEFHNTYVVDAHTSWLLRGVAQHLSVVDRGSLRLADLLRAGYFQNLGCSLPPLACSAAFYTFPELMGCYFAYMILLYFMNGWGKLNLDI